MMTSHVGVIRDGETLAQAVRSFAVIERDAENVALRNMATAALLVAASAYGATRKPRRALPAAIIRTSGRNSAYRTMTTLSEARDIAASLSETKPARNKQPISA